MGSPISLGSRKFAAFGKGRLPLPEEKNIGVVNYAVYSGSGALAASNTVQATVVQAAPLTLGIRIVNVEGYAFAYTAAGAAVEFEVLRMTLFNSALAWNFQPIPNAAGGSAAFIVAGNPYQNNSLKMDFSDGLIYGYAGSNLNVEFTFMKTAGFAGTDSYTYSVKIGWQPI